MENKYQKSLGLHKYWYVAFDGDCTASDPTYREAHFVFPLALKKYPTEALPTDIQYQREASSNNC